MNLNRKTATAVKNLLYLKMAVYVRICCIHHHRFDGAGFLGHQPSHLLQLRPFVKQRAAIEVVSPRRFCVQAPPESLCLSWLRVQALLYCALFLLPTALLRFLELFFPFHSLYLQVEVRAPSLTLLLSIRSQASSTRLFSPFPTGLFVTEQLLSRAAASIPFAPRLLLLAS